MKTLKEWVLLNEDNHDTIKDLNSAIIQTKQKGANEKNYQLIVWEIINFVNSKPKLKSKYTEGDSVTIPLKILQDEGILLGPEIAKMLSIYKPRIISDSSFDFDNGIVTVEKF